MNKRELGDMLADQWLASVSAYHPFLVDTHERYLFNGTQCPVLRLPVDDWGRVQVLVFRYLPLNSEVSRLAFLP